MSRRILAIVLGSGLVLGSTAVVAAAKPPPPTHDITLSAATTDVSATCVEGTPPCATVRLAFAGTVTGAPFTEMKNVKGPQSFAGSIDVPTSTYDSGSGCYSGVTGTIAFAVPQGPHSRHAFRLELANGTACGGGVTGTFTVDSSGAQVPAFRRSVGSGIFALSSDLDVATPSASAITLDLAGEIALAK